MTRDEFMRRLTRGLEGLPQATIDEMLADYADHFEAASAEGRSDAEVAAALGDPARLARELKLEAGIKRWQEVRSPSSAWAAVIAFLGLGAIDILILLPVLLPAIGVMVGLCFAVIGIFVGGGAVLIVGPFNQFPGGPLAAVLSGLGMMAGAVSLGALLAVAAMWLVNGLMWFGRLHYRVIEPAISSER